MRAPLKSSSANTFYILDLDRHLVDSIKLEELFVAVAAKATAIPARVIRRAREDSEKNGISFDTVEYIKPILKETGYPIEKIVEDFVATARHHDVFEPGAVELLALMRELNLPFAILTYGGAIWQEAKIRASNLEEIAYLITSVKEKGRLIDSWHQTDTNEFQLPKQLVRSRNGRVNTVMLLDDKASSFIGLPQSAVGLHVLPSSKKVLDLQKGEVGSNVTVVTGLYEAADYIRTYLNHSIDKT